MTFFLRDVSKAVRFPGIEREREREGQDLAQGRQALFSSKRKRMWGVGGA